MSELLIELFSEEIPARMQKRAGEDLVRLVTDALKEAGVESKNARAFATPRRLTLVIDGLPDKTPDVKEERKGPKVGAPQQAIDGFLRAAGLASIDQATVQEDRKGAFYVAVTEKKGRDTAALIAEIVPSVIRAFPGRNRCAGAPVPCAGCGRCIQCSAFSAARRFRSKSTASNPATRRMATASWRLTPSR